MPAAYYRELKGYKYQLTRDYTMWTPFKGYNINTTYIALMPDGALTIRRGYIWDGPSGPTLDIPEFMRGALVHDAFYQLMRMGKLPQDFRDDADLFLRTICLEDGMPKIMANAVYEGVEHFAGFAAKSKQREAFEIEYKTKGDE